MNKQTHKHRINKHKTNTHTTNKQTNINRVDDKGRTYFVDHFNQRTQWADPRVNATQLPVSSRPLPDGWEER